MFPGLKTVISDALYMKMCVIVGNLPEKKQMLKKADWRKLVNNFQVMHKLDPYFFDPYYMEAAYVSWHSAKYPEIIENINKNLETYGLKFCKDWRIPFFLGFNYFYFLNNPYKGALYLKMASKYPKAPSYIKLLAQKLFAKSGKYDIAIAVTIEEIKQTNDNELKSYLEKRLVSLRNMKLIMDSIERFKRNFRRCPKTVEDLTKTGLLKSIPKDPFGGKYYITKNCLVWTTSDLRPR